MDEWIHIATSWSEKDVETKYYLNGWRFPKWAHGKLYPLWYLLIKLKERYRERYING